ncbi:MAG: hypothetical protein AB7O24_30560, partial [Kofleriaceae bacterium]
VSDSDSPHRRFPPGPHATMEEVTEPTNNKIQNERASMASRTMLPTPGDAQAKSEAAIAGDYSVLNRRLVERRIV